MKGLMNHPILKVETNVGLLRTQTRGEIVLKWNRIQIEEYMPPLLRNAVWKDKGSQREPMWIITHTHKGQRQY
jgi:hypothetical protein